MSAAIRVENLEVAYGRIRALQGVSLEVQRGDVTALVGANGAGKSTLLKAIAGLVPARGGTVEIPAGTDVGRIPAHRRVRDLGLVLVPEGRSVFGTMTVSENLDMGAEVGRLRANGDVSTSREDVFRLFPVLEERRQLEARYLSGGEQQMLSLARALLMEPAILLVDEPSMGLAPLVVREIFETLRSVLERNQITVFLVEQDTRLALSVADWAYVLDRGRIEVAGTADEVASEARLQDAYLGAAEAKQ
jgi:branched-chain amino acid transport system ATP-binding protein